MNNLEQQVKESASALQQAWAALQQNPGLPAIPRVCYEQWIKRAALHPIISGTQAIFSARETASLLVLSTMQLQNAVGNPANSKVRYGQFEMDFAVARHLSLTSYVSITWSIYDRLANVCGRLAGTSELAENPKRNPKVCEDLLGKHMSAFSSHLHMLEAYSWPLKVSYKVRNWLVHEGYEEGSTQLFLGSKLADGFHLHAEAKKHLQVCCDHKEDVSGKIKTSCISEADECWKHGDLLRILEQYNKENDIMFTALLKWSVDSFVGQIKAFGARDYGKAN